MPIFQHHLGEEQELNVRVRDDVDQANNSQNNNTRVVVMRLSILPSVWVVSNLISSFIPQRILLIQTRDCFGAICSHSVCFLLCPRRCEFGWKFSNSVSGISCELITAFPPPKNQFRIDLRAYLIKLCIRFIGGSDLRQNIVANFVHILHWLENTQDTKQLKGRRSFLVFIFHTLIFPNASFCDTLVLQNTKRYSSH